MGSRTVTSFPRCGANLVSEGGGDCRLLALALYESRDPRGGLFSARASLAWPTARFRRTWLWRWLRNRFMPPRAMLRSPHE